MFFAQVECCDNVIFHRRAALDALGERLFDANRTIGQPSKLAAVFGRTITTRDRGKLETRTEDRLYQRVVDDVDLLLSAVGLKVAA